MTRPLAMILVALVVMTWAVAFLLDGKSLDATFLKPFSIAVGVLTGVGFAYEHWLWHWPGIHLLARKPRLTGTWVGDLRSDYKRDPNDEALPPIQGVLVITQTASGLHVRQFTKESSSTSVAASIEVEQGDRFSLSTVYRNEPGLDLQDRNPIHYGATRLAIEGAPREAKRLTGFYWTSRKPTKTAGMMDFRFVTRDVVHSFEEGLAATSDSRIARPAAINGFGTARHLSLRARYSSPQHARARFRAVQLLELPAHLSGLSVTTIGLPVTCTSKLRFVSASTCRRHPYLATSANIWAPHE